MIRTDAARGARCGAAVGRRPGGTLGGELPAGRRTEALAKVADVAGKVTHDEGLVLLVLLVAGGAMLIDGVVFEDLQGGAVQVERDLY